MCRNIKGFQLWYSGKEALIGCNFSFMEDLIIIHKFPTKYTLCGNCRNIAVVNYCCYTKEKIKIYTCGFKNFKFVAMCNFHNGE